MLNGKFYTGLPPEMIDRNPNASNRQQSHFFWPDDSNAEPAAPPRTRRTQSIKPTISDGVPNNKREQQHLERTKLFSNEFNKSNIQFYDIPDKGKEKSGGSSKSQMNFYDFVGEELNNQSVVNQVRVEERNLKSEVEKNLKNSPKLQNKKMDDQIKIITNDVEYIKKILKPSNTSRAKLRGDVMEQWDPKLNRKVRYKDEVDDRYDYDNEDSSQFYPKSPLPRHKFCSRFQQNPEEQQISHDILPTLAPNLPITYSHKHLVSNINFQSDNSYYNNDANVMQLRRNARSSAVSRVSVGFPEEN